MAASATDQLIRNPVDYLVALGFAFAFPLARLLLDTYVFKPIGRRVLARPKKSDDGWTAEDEARLFKWKESTWKALVYLSLAGFAYYAVAGESLLNLNAESFFGLCTGLPCDGDIKPAVRLIYQLEMGFYIQAIPVLIFWEVRRKDFLESFAHHVVTLALILYSYYLNLTTVGAVVFLLHDINDIFMEAAKLTRYAGAKRLPDLLFVMFMLSWIASRCLYFPLVVIRATLFGSREIARRAGYPLYPHYYTFNGFLLILLALHIYWSYLIGRIVWRVVKGNELDDVREEDDD